VELSEIMTHNRATRWRAQLLNERAGEKVFPVMNQQEIETWLRERLAGARCVSEVKDLGSLVLPMLDEALASQVESENPDVIHVLGRPHKVMYSPGMAPRVSLDDVLINAKAWKDLPDSGIFLPGGRAVEMLVEIGYSYTVGASNIPELKALCKAHLNKGLWTTWTYGSKPPIALPDLAGDPDAFVPTIVEVPYGTSVVDSTPLIAYGAVCLKQYRYYGSDPWFEGRWFQTQWEARDERAKSVAKLDEIREAVVEQQRLESERAAMSDVRSRLESLPRQQYWHRLRADLQQQVWDRIGARSIYERSAQLEWHRKNQEVLARVEAVFEIIASKGSSAQQSPIPIVKSVEAPPKLAQPAAAPAAPSGPLDLSKVDLSQLFGGDAKMRRK